MKVRFHVLVLVCGLTSLVGGCAMPGAVQYRPATGDEATLYSRARRDVLPADVREDPQRFDRALVAWTGVLREAVSSGSSVTFVVEHRYWDWVVDYGTQSSRAFLSPRGEGAFQFALDGERGDWLADKAAIEQMVLVYGTITGEFTSSGAVILDYAHARGLPKGLYTTGVWDYGREFAVHGRGRPTLIDLQSF